MTSPYMQKNYNRSFGTWPLQGDDLKSALGVAINAGYRAIDTAQMYQNEDVVGDFIADCGIARDDLFITTKVLPDNYSPEKFIPSVKESLQKLGVDTVDSLLLHWPVIDDGDNTVPLQLLEESHKQGLTKHIGVSNYNSTMLQQAVDTIDTPIACNQVEFHPLLNQDKLLSAANKLGIPLTAYCPVARGEVFKYDLFTTIGDAIGKTAGQVVLKWILQKGVTLQVMSTNPVNIAANYALDGWELSDDQMAQIDALTQTNYRIVNISLVPWCPTWD